MRLVLFATKDGPVFINPAMVVMVEPHQVDPETTNIVTTEEVCHVTLPVMEVFKLLVPGRSE